MLRSKCFIYELVLYHHHIYDTLLNPIYFNADHKKPFNFLALSYFYNAVSNNRISKRCTSQSLRSLQ